MKWIYWAILAAAVLHVAEECATGFLPWFRRVLPSLAPAMTVPWAVTVNALFLLVCLAAAALPQTPPVVRLVAPGVLLMNAALHVGMTLIRREFSPGLVTACVLYVPLGIIAFDRTTSAHNLGPGSLAAAAILSIAVHAVAPISLRILVQGCADRSPSAAPRAR